MAKKEGVSCERIIADLQQKIYKNVYLLMGAEAYYIDKISDYIAQNVLSESEKDFNQTILYGLDTDISTIINTAKRYPMMSDYQVVIIKEAQNIKKDWDNLLYYLQNPLKSTVLVICYKHGTPDKRSKWVKEIEKIGVVFESPEIPDYEIESWVKAYIQSAKIEMDSKSVSMLCEFLGTNLTKIVNELDKLIITLPDNSRKITAEHIEKNIGISKDYNVFELQDAIIQKDVLKANRIVRYFAHNSKANPIQMVLPQLFNFFVNILLYHYLPPSIKIAGNESFNDRRAKSLEIGKSLGIPPYPAADKVATAARNYNAWKTMNIISYLRGADAASKGFGTAKNDLNEIYKELLFKILH
ncbi:MAG: DNA polymerase III subunit delta [Prevotellaceae bacterium]|jgi:DNA polymerase-3 subunit delta|nr:DNA polymerase III subunit delta [Prevotellaceae bacterium]